MIIVSTQNSYDWSQAQLYKFADQEVIFQTPCKVLERFHVDEAPLEMVVQGSMALQEYHDREKSDSRPRAHYQGPAPFGNKEREVTYRRRGNFAEIDLDGDLVCEIDFNYSHIHLIREGGFSNLVNVELVTGPAMMIVLAKLKTYCLHASAVLTPQGVVAITGESGAGKSTLAWHAGDAWQQLADDIVPILYDSSKSGVQLSTYFPQLKLEHACAPVMLDQAPKVDFILRINPKPAKEVNFRLMSKAEGMLQFVRHTVGVRLFDEKVMRRHTKFAQYVGTKVPVIEANYPRDLFAMTELREQIIDYLAQLNVARSA